MSDKICLYLVRHGEATGGWDQDPDPGLSEKGREQAAAMAAKLQKYGPLPIVTSPMRRTRETAAAFQAVWPRIEPVIDPRISEVPSPSEDLQARREWLTEVMAGGWSDEIAEYAGEHDLGEWREGVIEALLDREEDTVFTTHFIAINVVVGHILKDDRVLYFRPDNCSVTVIEKEGRTLRLASLGREAETEVR